jgi:hypothetical protein
VISRYLFLYKINKHTQEEIGSKILSHCLREGFLMGIASDREFDFKIFKEISERFLVKQFLTKSYTPNPMVERYVGLTKSTVKKLLLEVEKTITEPENEMELNFEKLIKIVVYAMNTRINSICGV